MAIPNDITHSTLSPAQERALAEIVQERFGEKLSDAQFVDCLNLLCEDVAGFETRNVSAEVVCRIWTEYKLM